MGFSGNGRVHPVLKQKKKKQKNPDRLNEKRTEAKTPNQGR